MDEMTAKCPMCGKPYVVYSHYAGDQSVCSDCRDQSGGDRGGQTIRCNICGRPYKFYSHYVGDQSACPSCILKARNNEGKWSQS